MRYPFFLILASIIGYLPYVSGYYVALFSGDDFKLIEGRFINEVVCTEVSEESYCSNKWIIDSSLFSKKYNTLGLGIIIYSVKIGCVDDSSKHLIIDDINIPGRRYNRLNKFTSASILPLNCKGDVYVEAWSKHGAIRQGHISGKWAIGSSDRIEAYRSFFDFFTNDIRLMSALLFITFYIFSLISNNIAGSTFPKLNLLKYEGYWVGFLVTSSGIIQTFFPFDTPVLFSRISGYFSLVAHLGTAFYLMKAYGPKGLPNSILDKFLKNTMFSKVSVMELSFLLLAASQFFLVTFGPLAVVMSVLVVIVGVVNKKSDAFLFGITLLINSLVLFNIPYLPHSNLTSMFMTLVVGAYFFSNFNLSMRITIINKWANIFNRKIDSGKWEDKIRELVTISRANRVSLVQLGENSECTIYVGQKLDNGKIEITLYEKESLPPIFAHVISKNSELWHVNDRSETASLLRSKGSTNNTNQKGYNGSHFSVFPLMAERGPMGAIAFTEYDKPLSKDKYWKNELNSIIGMIRQSLVARLENERASNGVYWGNKYFSLINDFENMHSDIFKRGNLSGLKNVALDNILKAVDSYGFLAKLDMKSRKFSIVAINGYSREVKKRLLSGEIYARKDNLFGPIALCVNERKTIIVPELNWLEEVMHPLSNDILKLNNTNSCAAVPIYIKNETTPFEPSIWGVLWLERNGSKCFTFRDKLGLDKIGNGIGKSIEFFENRYQLQSTKNALTSFVPKSVAMKLLNNKPTIEKDFGLLVMFDFRNSTSIAKHIGGEGWYNLVREFVSTIEPICGEYKMTLQKIIWDAVYFTADYESNDCNKIVFIEKAVDMANAIYRKYEREHIEIKFPVSAIRACISIGDTSRDLTKGKNQTWEIIGDTMAEVNKMEQNCKAIEGNIFCFETFSSHLISNKSGWTFHKTDKFVGNRQIYSIAKIRSKKKAA